MNISPISLYHPGRLSRLTRRFKSLGLDSRDARQLTWYIHNQARRQGLVNTIAHLKNVSNAILASLTGVSTGVVWVALYQGFPKRFLFLRKYSREILFRLTKLHMCIVLDAPTHEQVLKFVSAVRTPLIEDLTDAHELIAHGVSEFNHVVQRGFVGFPLGLMPMKVNAKASRASSLSKKRKSAMSIEHAAKLVTKSLDYLASPIWNQLLSNKFVMDAFYPLDREYFGQLTDLYSHRLHHAPSLASKLMKLGITSRLEPAFVGSLGFSQEPGGKLRVFASPYMVWQAALEPLKNYLQDQLRSMKQDCTHDQESGARWAQEQLRLGKVVHAVDLRNATDLFPLELQMGMLRHEKLNVPAPLLKLFHTISVGTWKVPAAVQKLGYPPELCWTRGQPLGLGPSFAAFSLTHHMLVQGECHKLGIDPDCYRIVGDDIIIADERLAHAYKLRMDSIGAKVAHEKCTSSSAYAEFAGYRITPDLAVRPGKFRVLTQHNVMSIAKELRSDLSHEVVPELSLLMRKMLSLPPAYGGVGMDLEDPTDLMSGIDDERAAKLHASSGELLEKRLCQIILATGLVTRLPQYSLQNSRFNQYIEIINYGLEKGHLTRSNVKRFGPTWAISVVEECVKAQLIDRQRDVSGKDTELRMKFGVPLSADLVTARKRVTLFFQRYYTSLSNLSNSQMLVSWVSRRLGDEHKVRKFSLLLK